MMEQILIVLVGIMVFQPMLLLVGGDAGTGEKFVKPKLLEWFRFGAASCHGDRLGCSWSATGLTVACLSKTVWDPAVYRAGWRWPWI
jgi:hypothetical protein